MTSGPGPGRPWRAVLLAIFAAALPAWAGPLDGQWEGRFTPPDGSEDVVLTFKFREAGDRLSGTLVGPQGAIPIEGGTVEGRRFAFRVVVDGKPIVHQGLVSGNWIDLRVLFGPGRRPVRMTLQRLDAAGNVILPPEPLAPPPPGPPDPGGFWLWNLSFPGGGPSIVEIADFKYQGGELTGWRRSNLGPRLPIARASFRGGWISFTVDRSVDGYPYAVAYRGKLAGNAITGTVSFPSVNGNPPSTSPWAATRSP